LANFKAEIRHGACLLNPPVDFAAIRAARSLSAALMHSPELLLMRIESVSCRNSIFYSQATIRARIVNFDPNQLG